MRTVAEIDDDLAQRRIELIVAEDSDRMAIADLIRWEIRQLQGERDLAIPMQRKRSADS